MQEITPQESQNEAANEEANEAPKAEEKKPVEQAETPSPGKSEDPANGGPVGDENSEEGKGAE